MEAQPSFSYSKKNKREMTSFVTRELLYDYLSEQLDDERRLAVENQLRSHRELQLELHKIRAGISYVESLGQTKISPAVLDEIGAPETYLSVLLKKTKYEQWPLTVKWGLEALIVLTCFIFVLVLVPWDKALQWGISLRGGDWILAEVPREIRTGTGRLQTIEKNESGAFEDEGVDQKIATTKEAIIPQIVLPAAAVPAIPSTGSKTTPIPPAAPAKAATAASTVTTKSVEKKQVEGSLYRGSLAVTNLSMIGPKVTEKILELGGRKAGEVELGWMKTPGSSYYHFTIPEAKYDELQKFFSETGQVRVSKEKHPRVMPEGIIRLIITVEEAQQ